MKVVRNWYVVFDSFKKQAPWFRPFVEPGFEHAYLIGLTGDGESFAFECARPGVQVVRYNQQTSGATISRLFREATAVVEVHNVHLTRRFPPPVVGVRCVRLIKRVTGLRGLAVTPYQTFCALRDAGHAVIVGPN